MPETSIYDFFDYLAGEKLDISEEKSLVEELKITFKHIDSIPEKLWKNKLNINVNTQKNKEKLLNCTTTNSKRIFDKSMDDETNYSTEYKPIFLREVKLNSSTNDSSLFKSMEGNIMKNIEGLKG